MLLLVGRSLSSGLELGQGALHLELTLRRCQTLQSQPSCLHVLLAVATLSEEGIVGAGEAPFLVEVDRSLRLDLERGAEPLLAGPDLDFGLLALGLVGNNADDPVGSALGVNTATRPASIASRSCCAAARSASSSSRRSVLTCSVPR